MQTSSFRFGAANFAWRGLLRKLAPHRAANDCMHSQGIRRHFGLARPQVQLEGSRYCIEHCLERALGEALYRVRSLAERPAPAHRVPLGLQLLSRQQLTFEQLRSALDAQRSAGRGRIGEWLQKLGFVAEPQITAALARQWSCPVLRQDYSQSKPGGTPQIPVALLQNFFMIPIHFVESAAILHLAFGDRPDYSALYAIEKMLDCRTEHCLASPGFVRSRLQSLSLRRNQAEAVFDCPADGSEFARIVRSYCSRLAPSEIRLAACGPFLWVRLLWPSRPAWDLGMFSPR
jgi:hypothetical protein